MAFSIIKLAKMYFFNFLFFFFNLILISFCEINNENHIIIDTKLGKIVGLKENVYNKTINVFYGVPYSEPPINDLRFRKTFLINELPQNPYYATTLKPHCAQKKSSKYEPDDIFSEDCLYMNIFVPNLDKNKLNDNFCSKYHPVMIYIYGGISSNNQKSSFNDKNQNKYLTYSGDIYASVYDTIVVTFNYRQQAFSQLVLENEFPGNLVLFDQNLAIKFVKKYINNFCGDNNKITLFGNSLGSYSISLHLISDYSKNLINNAIMQSGSALYQNVLPASRKEIEMASLLAINDLGCLTFNDSSIENHLKSIPKTFKKKIFDILQKKNQIFSFTNATLIEKIILVLKKNQELDNLDKNLIKLLKLILKKTVDLNCLKSVPTEKIVNLSLFYDFSMAYMFYYDYDFIPTESILDYKLSNELNLNPNVNLLIGGLSDESCTYSSLISSNYDKTHSPLISKQKALEIIETVSKQLFPKNGVSSIIAKYYTDETKWQLSKGYAESVNNYFSEIIYTCPSYFYSKYSALKANSVYNYFITYYSSKHFSSQLSSEEYENLSWLGPCHADDLIYIFGLPLKSPAEFSKRDQSFSLKLMYMWNYFAKFGKMPLMLPSLDKWPYSNKFNRKLKYVEINENFIRENEFEFIERCENLWLKLLPIYKV